MKTYNFIEAVNSGSRFRPANWSEPIDGKGWYSVNNSTVVYDDDLVKCRKLDIKTDVLNCDYELEENSITITESDFDKVTSEEFAKLSIYTLEKIKKDLGFTNE